MHAGRAAADRNTFVYEHQFFLSPLLFSAMHNAFIANPRTNYMLRSQTVDGNQLEGTISSNIRLPDVVITVKC